MTLEKKMEKLVKGTAVELTRFLKSFKSDDAADFVIERADKSTLKALRVLQQEINDWSFLKR